MEKTKSGGNKKIIIIAVAAVIVIVAAIFGIKALIPEKTPSNDKAKDSKAEVITLPGEDVTDVTAITGTDTDKKGITDKENHKIYDTGYKDDKGKTIYTTGKKDADGNILYTLNKTDDVGRLIYYTGKVENGKLRLTKTNAIPDYSTNENSKLTNSSRYTTTATVKYEAPASDKEAAKNTKALASKFFAYSGGSKEDLFKKIIAAEDGGFIAAGNTNSKDGIYKNAGSSWKDLFGSVSKISADGKFEWTYVTGGNAMVLFEDVAQLKDGSVIAVGQTCATDTSAPRTGLSAATIIVKLDKNGKEVWSTAFPCNEEEKGDMAYSVAATPDGGFVVGGEANSTTGFFKDAPGEYKAYIFKFNKKGSVEWKKILSGSRSNKISALAVNDKGEIFASCVTHSYDGNFASLAEYKVSANNPNTVILKLNKKGDLIWSHNIASWGRSEFNSIAATSDGGCVTGGTMSILKRANGSFSQNYGETDGYVVRLSADGKVYWAHNVGGTLADSINDITVTDNAIVVSGSTKSSNLDFAGLISAGKTEGFVTVMNNSGTILFSNLIGGSSDDYINSVCATEKGIAVAGYTKSADGVFKDSKANNLAQAFVASYDFSAK